MPKSTLHGGVTNEAVEQSRRTGVVPEPDPEPEHGKSDPETDQPVRPAAGEPKSAWVDYAVSQGVVREEAERLTKADLLDRYKD